MESHKLEYKEPTAEELIARATREYHRHFSEKISPPLEFIIYILLEGRLLYSQTQVARILNLSQGTVSKKYNKAKQIIKEHDISYPD